MNKKEFLANQAMGFENLMNSNEIIVDEDKAAKFARTSAAPAPAPKVGEEFEVLAFAGNIGSATTGQCHGKFACARGNSDDSRVIGITTTMLLRSGQRFSKTAHINPLTVAINPTVLQAYPEDKFNLIPVYSFSEMNTADFSARIQKAGKLVLAGEENVEMTYSGAVAKNSIQRWCIVEPKEA